LQGKGRKQQFGAGKKGLRPRSKNRIRKKRGKEKSELNTWGRESHNESCLGGGGGDSVLCYEETFGGRPRLFRENSGLTLTYRGRLDTYHDQGE